jgi:hypothetical protein
MKNQNTTKDRESWKYQKVVIGSISPETKKTAKPQIDLKTEAKEELSKES